VVGGGVVVQFLAHASQTQPNYLPIPI